MKTVAANMKRLRGERTQRFVGESVGIVQQTWQSYEDGQGNPTLSTLCKIAEAVGVTVENLLSDSLEAVEPAYPVPPALGETVQSVALTKEELLEVCVRREVSRRLSENVPGSPADVEARRLRAIAFARESVEVQLSGRKDSQ